MRRIAALILLLLPAVARADPVCLPPPYLHAQSEDEHYLAGLVAELRPTLARHASLIAALEELGPELCLAEVMSGAEGYFDPAAMRIVLARGHTPFLHQAIFLHELRHLDQFSRGFCPDDALMQADHVRAVYAMEADASAISLLLAWERLMEGEAGVWEAMLNWPSQADIAAEMAREFFRTGYATAMAATAFTQWYASETRRERYYVASCSAYLERREGAQSLPATGTLPEDFLDRLCRLPDGVRYPCIERERGRR